MFVYNNTQELFKTLNLELEFNLFKDLYITKNPQPGISTTYFQLINVTEMNLEHNYSKF